MNKQGLDELLQQALDDIDEVGGRERHLLVQTIGRPTYDKLISKPKGADLVDRWLSATGKAKAPATKALAVAIARTADRADLTGRIEREIGDAFDEGRESTERGETPKLVSQKRNEKPKIDLAALARSSDLSKYMKARQNSRH